MSTSKYTTLVSLRVLQKQKRTSKSSDTGGGGKVDLSTFRFVALSLPVFVFAFFPMIQYLQYYFANTVFVLQLISIDVNLQIAWCSAESKYKKACGVDYELIDFFQLHVYDVIVQHDSTWKMLFGTSKSRQILIWLFNCTLPLIVKKRTPKDRIDKGGVVDDTDFGLFLHSYIFEKFFGVLIITNKREETAKSAINNPLPYCSQQSTIQQTIYITYQACVSLSAL